MTSPPHRRWFVFHLRTVLVATVVMGFALTPLAIKLKKTREERTLQIKAAEEKKKALEWVVERGGSVQYDGKSVQSISFKGGQVAVLTPLRPLSSLQELTIGPDVWVTRLTDLSPLKSLTNLRKLHLYDTNVSDISPLRELADLEERCLHSAIYLDDVEPLRALTNLRILDLSSTNIRKVSSLEKLSSLRELHLAGTDLSDEKVARLKKALPNCRITR